MDLEHTAKPNGKLKKPKLLQLYTNLLFSKREFHSFAKLALKHQINTKGKHKITHFTVQDSPTMKVLLLLSINSLSIINIEGCSERV